jgi:ribonuclease P protein component
MGALYCRVAALRAGRSSRSVTRELSGTESKPAGNSTPAPFPKSARILKSSEFRQVYEQGSRVSTPYFAAFCLAGNASSEPRVGFTTPRALGKAVVRNRIKRRMREAVRLNLHMLAPGWMVVFNPRRAVQTAPFTALRSEVEKVFRLCVRS